MIPTDLHGLFPQAIFLLPIAGMIFFLLWQLFLYRKDLLNAHFSTEIQKKMVVHRSFISYFIKVAAVCLAWIMATFALMGPVGNGHYPMEEGLKPSEKPPKEGKKEGAIQRKAHDVVFLIDASASMEVKDTRTGVSRLEFSKEIADEIMSRLKGESAALYAFTSDTTKLSPPTMDYLFVRLALRAMEINEGDIAGTNVVEALADMRDAFFLKKTDKLKTIVILTDGGDTQLEGTQGDARKRQIDSMLSILNPVQEHHVRIFTIGMGTEQGQPVPGIEDKGQPVISSLDEELLKALADKGRGSYYFANQWTSIDLAEDLIKKMGEESPFLEDKVSHSDGIEAGKGDLIYDLFFQIPLGCALFLLGWVLFSPDTGVRTLSLIVLLSLPLNAEEESVLIRHAEVYAEAGEYDQARVFFEKLEREKLFPWQKARLHYNLGTLFLDQGLYDEALQEYVKVPISPKTAPFLSRAIATNLAVLKLEQAKTFLSLSPSSFEEMSRALSLVREASQHLEEVEEAECMLEVLQGRVQCRFQEDVKKLHTAAKVAFALIAQKLGYLKITSTPVQEGIPFLLSGVNLAQSHLAFLERIGEDVSLKEQYQQLFVRDLESWLLLWEFQVDQMSQLQGAEAFFQRGVNQLKEGKWGESRLAFLSAEAVLNLWMKTVLGNHPLREIVQKLLIVYQQALDQNPIQPPMLYQLTAEQTHLKDLMESKGFSLEKILVADEMLKKSIDFAQSGKRIEALFYLLEARQQIRRVLRSVVEKEFLPEDILDQGIEEEVHALTLTHLLRRLQDKAEYSRKTFEAQQTTLVSVFPFFESVIKEQKKRWPFGCQCLPWKQVVPLFIKGESAALDAAILSEKEPESPRIMRKQEEAVKYWREALERLRHPKEEKKEKEDEETPSSPPPETQETPSMQEILRQLQNMAQDDVKPKPEKEKPQQGTRPW